MPLVIREGRLEDSFLCFQIFISSVEDLSRRIGASSDAGDGDEEKVQELWQHRRGLFEHLAENSDNFWIAEVEGGAVGYARSILRDGVRELTEFFVLPGEQSAGVGRELLAKALPEEANKNRFLIATLDTRAQMRYMKAGFLARFPVCHFSTTPQIREFESDIQFESLSELPEVLENLAAIDRDILGYERNIEHRWLMKDRKGFLYRRNGKFLGYGYVGFHAGPFALLDNTAFPDVLAHAESESATAGYPYFGMEIPMMNQHGVNCFVERGYKLDSFYEFFMAEQAFGKFEQYIFTSPPFFV